MKPLSSIHPLLYKLSVYLRRLKRRLSRRFDGVSYSIGRSNHRFDYALVEHKSLLLRKLSDTDMELQRNKVESLRVACSLIDSVVIEPGEVFSFWHLVGRPARSRGFPPGLQLSFGSLVSMEGGGLCQLSNLLHWMVLQTPLTVVERHRHSTDPFPDYRRTVPFGTGATVFYNYLDFAFRNDTAKSFQICVSVGQEYLEGEIRTESELPCEYTVEEKEHEFIRSDDGIVRRNELWRVVRKRSSGEVVEKRLLMRNRCRVLYHVSEEMLSSREE